MHFKTVLVSCLASVALGSPVESVNENVMVPFDLPTIQATFDQIVAGIGKMVENVNKFSGDAKQMEPMLTSSSEILKALTEGTAKISKSPIMGIDGAVGVLGPVQVLSSKVDDIVSALTAKKDVFEKAGVTSVVVQELQKQRKGAKDLADSILGNLPLAGILGGIAAPIAKQVTDKLDAGIKTFGAEPPTDSPGVPTAKPAAAPKAAKTSKGKAKNAFVVPEALL